MNYNLIEQVMKERHLRKADVIALAKISKGTLENVLQGRDFKVSTLEALANVLQKPVGFFFEEKASSICNGDETESLRKYVSQLLDQNSRLIALLGEKSIGS